MLSFRLIFCLVIGCCFAVDPSVILFLNFEDVSEAGVVSDLSGSGNDCQLQSPAEIVSDSTRGKVARFGKTTDTGRVNCGKAITMTLFGGYISVWVSHLSLWSLFYRTESHLCLCLRKLIDKNGSRYNCMGL
jgi:hypothetical protein